MSQVSSTIRQRLALPVNAEQYDKIRRLWIAHSRAEDARDLQGLVDTLAPTCVYHIIPTGQRWEGHDGARMFYTTFLTAFPDVHFDLQDIVIGPQGVIEIAIMTGTHQGEWNGIAPTQKKVSTHIIIHFPWNPDYQLFDGENVYLDRADLEGQLVEQD